MTQLACTHCGTKFEFEKKEGAVCPHCGWASSIVTVAELENQKKAAKPAAKPAKSASWLSGFFVFLLKIVAVIAIAALLVAGLVKILKFKPSKTEKKPKTEASVRLTPSQPLAKISHEKLDAGDKAVLESKLEVAPQLQLSDDERRQLQRAVDLTTDDVEKLPSANWTLEEYKRFIEAQEKRYRIPLPRSYKKDLEELFEKNYAPAYDLFLSGNIQAARDAYVAALAFPVYANDVRKHRAVVLTMLRDYINDTIAKIGAMNFALARQSSKGQSAQIGAAYAALQQEIRAEKWKEAGAVLKDLQAMLPETSAGAQLLQTPPYGAGFEKIDADIQPFLIRLLQVPAYGFDLEDLRGDLTLKRGILERLNNPERGLSIESYNKAVEKIKAKAWQEAVELLKQVKNPPELAQDADQKIKILERLTA